MAKLNLITHGEIHLYCTVRLDFIVCENRNNVKKAHVLLSEKPRLTFYVLQAKWNPETSRYRRRGRVERNTATDPVLYKRILDALHGNIRTTWYSLRATSVDMLFCDTTDEKHLVRALSKLVVGWVMRAFTEAK